MCTFKRGVTLTSESKLCSILRLTQARALEKRRQLAQTEADKAQVLSCVVYEISPKYARTFMYHECCQPQNRSITWS